jgi:prepilin peptidase CpaA
VAGVHQFEGPPLALAAGFVFSTILVVAAIGDLRTRRIPNKLVATLAVLGIAYSVARSPVFGGFIAAGGGILVGLACWLPFYMLGWLGAGDVKLYAAAGAWLGPLRSVEGAVVAALFGTLLSVIWMLKSQGVKNAAETLGLAAGSPQLLSPDPSGSRRSASLPYGVAIAFGALWAGWMPRLLNV